MTASETHYRIDSEAAGRRALQSLRESFPTRGETRAPWGVTYFDTFDWRLHTDGGALTAFPMEGSWLLSWRLRSGETRHQTRCASLPAFAEDLPPSPFRDELAQILEVRRLFPFVEAELRGQRLRVLDSNDKTIVLVELIHGTATRPQDAPPAPPAGDGEAQPNRGRVPLRIRVIPIRGYEDRHFEVVRFLEDEVGLRPDEGGELELALAALGRRPGDYSSKLAVELNPQEPAVAAARQIQRTLLTTMLANEEGTRRDLDSEFLHDFRVAVRRTRTALAQISGVFPQEAVDRFRQEFSWLGTLTGPSRDLDVYLLKLPAYRAALPEAVQADLDPLDRYLREHKRKELEQLAAGLASPRYRRLTQEWRTFLESDAPGPTDLPNAARPILAVATERIDETLRRVLEKGAAIGPTSPVSALHKLRIACKKLRYLLEFFRSLYEPDDLENLVQALKRLQDSLGDINDFQVQQKSLTRFAHEMVAEGIATTDSLLAMGRLLEHLERGRAEERCRFEKRFAGFASVENRERARRLLQAQGSLQQ
jgi:CHAD domain-containing protein